MKDIKRLPVWVLLFFCSFIAGVDSSNAEGPAPTPSGRDPRLEHAPLGNIPLTDFKFQNEAGKPLVQKMNLLGTNSKTIPIGVSTKKGESPKVVLTQDVTVDQVTSADIENVVSACHGPTRPVPFERNTIAFMNEKTTSPERKKSLQKMLDDYRERQKKEKKGVIEKLTQAVKDLKAGSIGDLLESAGHRRARIDDKRNPVKWYTWYAGIGTKEDPASSEAFGALMNEYMPNWYPDVYYGTESHRTNHPEVFSFKIDLECLKKAWHSTYLRALKETLKCELEFKPGVKPGTTFDPKSLKTLEFTGVKINPGHWTEFSVSHPKIKTMWCQEKIKTVADLSSFFDLSSSDLRLKDSRLGPWPTPKTEPEKSTTSTAPALSSALEKDDLSIPNDKSNSTGEALVKPAQ